MARFTPVFVYAIAVWFAAVLPSAQALPPATVPNRSGDFVLERTIQKTGRGLGQAISFVAPGGPVAALAVEGQIKLIDLSTGHEVRSFGSGGIFLRFSPNGQILAEADDERGPGGSVVKLWEVATGRLTSKIALKPNVFTWRGIGNAPPSTTSIDPVILAGDFSPDGRQLAVGGTGDVRLLDVAAGREVQSLGTDDIGFLSIAYSADGRTLAVVSKDGPVRLWQLASGKARILPRPPAPKPGVTCLCPIALSADGTRLAAGVSDGGVLLWNTRADVAAPPIRFKAAAKGVQALTFSPDGSVLVSGDDNGFLTVRDAYAGEILNRLRLPPNTRKDNFFVRSLGFSPDGAWLGVGTASAIQLWRHVDNGSAPSEHVAQPTAASVRPPASSVSAKQNLAEAETVASIQSRLRVPSDVNRSPAAALRGVKVTTRTLVRSYEHLVWSEGGKSGRMETASEEKEVAEIVAIDQTSPAAASGLAIGDVIENVIVPGADPDPGANLSAAEFYRRHSLCADDCLLMMVYLRDAHLPEGETSGTIGDFWLSGPAVAYTAGDFQWLVVGSFLGRERTVHVGRLGSNFVRVHTSVGLDAFKDLKTGHLIPASWADSLSVSKRLK